AISVARPDFFQDKRTNQFAPQIASRGIGSGGKRPASQIYPCHTHRYDSTINEKLSQVPDRPEDSLRLSSSERVPPLGQPSDQSGELLPRFPAINFPSDIIPDEHEQ